MSQLKLSSTEVSQILHSGLVQPSTNWVRPAHAGRAVCFTWSADPVRPTQKINDDGVWVAREGITRAYDGGWAGGGVEGEQRGDQSALRSSDISYYINKAAMSL